MSACPKPARGSRALELIEAKAKVRRRVEHARKQHQRAPGPTAQRRATKHARLVEAEVDAKQEVRARDGRCRWPFCPCQDAPFLPESALEVSHCLAHKGMGGDPLLLRTQRHLMILVCQNVHQGTDGIDKGRRKVVPLTERGTDGPCECFQLEPGEAGRWYSCGITFPPERTQETT